VKVHPFIRQSQLQKRLLAKKKLQKILFALWILEYIVVYSLYCYSLYWLQPNIKNTAFASYTNMAEPAPPSKTHLHQKTVQELVLSGEELPGNYIQKDRNVVDLDVPLVEIPVVDLGLLTSLSTSKEELEKLQSGLSSWGCFQV
jgi:hypothetical protein